MRQNAERKLRELNKIVNQIASSIRHRPFSNELDKARTLGFIKALRDVITSHGSKPIVRPKIYQAPENEGPVSSKEETKEAIRKVKQTLRSISNGDIQESTSE